MPPNSPPVTGSDEIRRFWTGFLATGSINATLTTDDVDQSGDLAVERGRYEMTIVPVNGTAPVHDAGKYVVSWRKINGQWRATNDIFNSSSPAQ
jgi:ketosteroid isomerase-like protein